MTTAADLIAESKRHLQSMQREPMNKLAADVTSAATSLTLQFDVTHVQAGAHLQVGLELLYVWSVDPGAKTVTVERAQLGSVAAAHAAGAVVTVNPKFPDFAILKAINDDLADLSSPANGLYAVREVDLTFSTGSSGYDLAGVTNLLEVMEVRHRIGPGGAWRRWPLLTNFEVSRDVNVTDFPSGLALFLSEGGASGQPLRVQYKASFASLTTLADDVETVAGLPSSMHDLPPMGAAMRLVAPREIKRNFTEAQGEPRRAAEVPPGAVQASLRGIAGLRQTRIVAEAARLAQTYPDRGFVPSETLTLRRAGSRWSRWV